MLNKFGTQLPMNLCHYILIEGPRHFYWSTIGQTVSTQVMKNDLWLGRNLNEYMSHYEMKATGSR